MKNHSLMKSMVKSNSETKAIVQQCKRKFPLLENSGELTERIEFFKALGDDTRLRIIAMLSIDDLCMCEIVSGLEIPSSTVSHHLKLLERGKVIKSRKEGRFTVYQLKEKKVLSYLT